MLVNPIEQWCGGRLTGWLGLQSWAGGEFSISRLRCLKGKQRWKLKIRVVSLEQQTYHFHEKSYEPFWSSLVRLCISRKGEGQALNLEAPQWLTQWFPENLEGSACEVRLKPLNCHTCDAHRSEWLDRRIWWFNSAKQWGQMIWSFALASRRDLLKASRWSWWNVCFWSQIYHQIACSVREKT